MRPISVCGQSDDSARGRLSESMKVTAIYQCFNHPPWEKPEVPFLFYHPLRLEAFSYHQNVDVSQLYASDAHVGAMYSILYLTDQMLHDLR